MRHVRLLRIREHRDIGATIIVATWRRYFVLLPGSVTVYWGFTWGNISRRWSRCSFVFLCSRRFFGQETFIKGYRGVTVKRERVLTIGQSSEVISNNPFQRPFCRGHLFTEKSVGALKSSIGFTIDGFAFSWNVRAPVIVLPSQYRQGINRSLILNVPVIAVACTYRLVCFSRFSLL